MEGRIHLGHEPSTSYMRMLLDKGEYLKAFDMSTWLLSESDEDRLEIIKLNAQCLSKLGMHEDAIARLEDSKKLKLESDSETHALLGSFYKRRWINSRDTDSKGACGALQNSFSEYMKARELGGDYWCAINAATLAKVLGEHELAGRFADEVNEECWKEYNRHGTTSSFWILASLGEAYLVKEEYDSAATWYRAARSHIGGNFGWLRSTRDNARLLLEVLNTGSDNFDQVISAIPRLRIAIFAGHRLDRPGRSYPRFPVEISAKVKQKLKKKLAHMKLDLGIASAADGSDILFHECLQDMGKRTFVKLPSPVDHFRRKISESAGEEWMSRFDKVVNNADHVEISSVSRFDSDAESIHSFCTDFMIGSSIDLARSFDAELVPVVIWDGIRKSSGGGTAYAVSRLRKLGYSPEEISLSSFLKPERSGKISSEEDEYSYQQLGIYEPRTRPIAVITAGISDTSEEINASRLSILAGAIMEVCKTNSINVIGSGFLPGKLYLIFESIEDLRKIIDTCRNELQRDSYHSMVFHMGMVIRTESSLTGSRDHYCRELDEVIALAMSLRFPSDVCTMQVKALIEPELEKNIHFGYRGRFETMNGNSLQIFSIERQ